VFWTFERFFALQTERRKLILGAISGVIVFPMLLLLINLVWLYGYTGWAGIRLDPVARVQPWVETMLGHHSVETDGYNVGSPMTFSRMVWVFIPTMTRGLSPAYALLMFGGIWGWRKVWSRRDHQSLFYVAVITMCGIWVQLWCDRDICPRYALPIVLMASPFAALGFWGFIGRILRSAQRLHGAWNRRGQTALIAVVGILVATLGLADAMTSNSGYFASRRMAADMGRWLQRTYPNHPPMLVGSVGVTPIASYYAHNAPYQAFRWEADDRSILDMVEQNHAGVVFLHSARTMNASRCATLLAHLNDIGMKPATPSPLPENCNDLYVLTRHDDRTARRTQP
jgi:hypothetical protein